MRFRLQHRWLQWCLVMDNGIGGKLYLVVIVDIIRHIDVIRPPNPSYGDDTLVWRWEDKQDDRIVPGRNWDALFPTICWQLWKRRFSILLDDQYKESEDLLLRSIRLANEFVVAFASSME
ncbi:hypothetical protein V6N12_007445 [Hibiscus sabdariffa]|uniref:Uncharacterized protein n=1 Tax=Hibiscus sabdariffa TaxID=183260 RepID=A0ABR2F1T5_9ROSI